MGLNVIKGFMFFAALMMSASGLSQGSMALDDLMVARTDENSLLAHEQLLMKVRQGRVDVYFAGDSILRRWGTSDVQYGDLLENWNENFFGWNAADFAWGGDTVQNVLWRLYDGELNGLRPKVFVLMAGTNNLGGGFGADGVEAKVVEAKVEEVVTGIGAILGFMQAKVPEATIILTGVLPRNGENGSTDLMLVIDRINEDIAALADGDSIRYININHQLADADGRLFEGVTVDGLHLSVIGYQVWADALKPILTELLGPPAEVDYAPAPTGNPAAQ